MRIGIAGVAGRMGQLLIAAAAAEGAVVAGGTLRPGGKTTADVTILPDITALAEVSDVVIDFTHATTVAHHAAALAGAGKTWILGTSGLSAADEIAVAEAAQTIPVVYAANFSRGVNLVLALARQMAALLPASSYDAEIVEMHHRQKVDAPSGTAIALGRAVAAGRAVPLEAVMESGRTGHTGARKSGAIGFAALRGGQVVGEHSLLFAGATEHISITHRAFDRSTYAAGAVQAAVWARTRSAGLYSMMDVLDIPPT